VWADAHRARTERWPTADSGAVLEAPEETWAAVDAALTQGGRGLEGGFSLARLLAIHRGVRNPKGLPPLTEEQVLAWADAYRERTGKWPRQVSGPIPEAPGETWSSVEHALYEGCRGLHGGSSLVRLLAHHRWVQNRRDFPPLTVQQVLAWADAHHARTGRWPGAASEVISGAAGETWLAVNHYLVRGSRGLPKGNSLAKLLAEHRGVRYQHSIPPLTVEQVLAWADAHLEDTGKWPFKDSGPVLHAPGEKWASIDGALRVGHRGLPAGSSLARLLAKHRWVRNRKALPAFTEERILSWADAYSARTGKWPTEQSGAIPEAPGETWMAVDAALVHGNRGLSGGSSLPRLLAAHRGVRNVGPLPALTEEQILAWADAYRHRHGKWPSVRSGSIEGTPGETWTAVQAALAQGVRGLAGGSSLARLLSARRGARNSKDLPPLQVGQILAWADAYRHRMGAWPRRHSGPISEAPGESWSVVDTAFRRGRRGLPGGSSLAKLLREHFGARQQCAATLTISQILEWAEQYYHRTGRRPSRVAGPIKGAPGQTWNSVDIALKRGLRGLPGGSSLALLLRRHRAMDG
jgi:hypothetical protein